MRVENSGYQSFYTKTASSGINPNVNFAGFFKSAMDKSDDVMSAKIQTDIFERTPRSDAASGTPAEDDRGNSELLLTDEQIKTLKEKYNFDDMFKARNLGGNLYTNLPPDKEKGFYGELKSLGVISEEDYNSLCDPRGLIKLDMSNIGVLKKADDSDYRSRPASAANLLDIYLNNAAKARKYSERDEDSFVGEFNSGFFERQAEAFTKVADIIAKAH